MSISKIKVGSTEHDLHASKLTTARTITLSGDVSGSTTFDGSGNVTITTAVVDGSHNHIISNVDGLQTALDGKAASSHTHNYAGSSSAGGVATSANALASQTLLTTAEAMDNFITGGQLKYTTFKLTEDSQNIGFAANDGMLLSIPWSSNQYGVQMAFDDATNGNIAVRGRSTNWGDWYKLIHSGNIGSQSVSYATSAGSATKATQDGNGNVITSTYAKKSHKHSVTAAGTNSSTSITPAGTISQPTFTGTAASHNHTFTGTAAEHNHTFTGTEKTVSVKYTPAGTVSSSFTGTAHNHTFSGTPATSGKPDTTNVTTIYSITGVGTLPSASLSSGTLPSCSYTAPSHTYTAPSLTGSVSNQCLTLTFNAGSHSFNAGSHSFNAGAFPTLTFSAGTLPTREAVSMPNTNHTHSVTATGTIGNATAGGSVSSTFAGTEATISHTFTPAGSISKTSITPAGTISSKELTPAGTVSKPTFTGTAASHTHTFTGSAVNSATES